MSLRKVFYTIIGVEIVALAALSLLAIKGTSSIGLCRYDMIHPLGYITPAELAFTKQIQGAAAITTCPKNVFSAVYFMIYLLIMTTLIYLIILLKKLFTKAEVQDKSDKPEQK